MSEIEARGVAQLLSHAPLSLVTADSCWERENRVTLSISVTLQDRLHAQEQLAIPNQRFDIGYVSQD